MEGLTEKQDTRVRESIPFVIKLSLCNDFPRQGFKHVFTSPSSVDKEPKATRSGNAYLHGMKSATKGSLTYIAMQACTNFTSYVSGIDYASRFSFH